MDACDIDIQHDGHTVTVPRLVLVSATSTTATVATPGRPVLVPFVIGESATLTGSKRDRVPPVSYAWLASLPPLTTFENIVATVNVDFSGRVTLVVDENTSLIACDPLCPKIGEVWVEPLTPEGYAWSLAPPLAWHNVGDLRVFGPATCVQRSCDLEGCSQHTHMTPPEKRCKRPAAPVYRGIAFAGKAGIHTVLAPGVIEEAMGEPPREEMELNAEVVAKGVRGHLVRNAIGGVQVLRRPKKVHKGELVPEQRLVTCLRWHGSPQRR